MLESANVSFDLLIDKAFIEEFQDVFVQTYGMSILTSFQGEERNILNPCALCSNCPINQVFNIKKCLQGNGDESYKKDSISFKCPMGLEIFKSSAIIEEEIVFEVFGGFVLQKPIDADFHRSIARKLGFEEKVYLSNIEKIAISTTKDINSAFNLLNFFTKSASEIIRERSETIQTNKNEELYRKIIETIRNSLNIKKIKRTIVNEIGQAFNAYRCFIVTTGGDGESFSIIDEDSVYLQNNRVKSVANYKPSVEFFSSTFRSFNEIIALDTDEFIAQNNLFDSDAQKYFQDYNVKTSISIPVVHLDKLYGVLVIHYDHESKNFSPENIDFIRMVAKQVGVALHQNFLLEKEKKAAEREFLLRKITKTIRSSIDIEETKQQIVNILGKTLDGDRCLILDYDKDRDEFMTIDNEYLSSENVLSLKWQNPDFSVPNFTALLKEGKPILIKNKTIYKDGKEFLFDTEATIIEKYNISSALVYPLHYSDEFLGNLAIHYSDNNHFILDEETLLIADIADQIALALHQAKLYDELKRTTANQNAILNNIPFLAWLKDSDSKILAANKYFADICGVPIESLIGKKDFDFFPQNHVEGYINADKQVMETGETISFIEQIKGPNNVRWYETFKTPVFDEKGRAIGTTGLANDITVKREVELELAKKHEEIQEAAKREKLLRETISEISSSFDSNEVRKFLVTKLGLALGVDLVAMYIKDTKTGKFLPVDEFSYYRNSEDIKNPEGVNVAEDWGFAVHINKNTKNYVVYSDIEQLKSDYGLYGTKSEIFLNDYEVKSLLGCPIVHSGEFLGFLTMNFIKAHRDFTEEDIEILKTIANQSAVALYQLQLYNQAQEASMAKSEFIANMSHEIKTPLNIIIGFSEIMLTSQIEQAQMMKYLDNINKSGKHLLNLTNDIINISKIESGKFEFKQDEFDSKKLINEVLEAIKLLSDSKSISFEVDTAKAILKADKKMITQVLYNLLNNAIKFTPEFGKIKIASEIKSNNLTVSIIDNGIGIDEKNQTAIFEKFKQVDSSLERAQQGAGLGLAITKRIVELHGGSIHVKSKLDEGSHFWFTLPNAK